MTCASEYTSFDILGRVTGHKQTTDGQIYTTAYVYNLSGALVEQTYPSGRVVKNVLDNKGDLEMVQSKKNSSAGYWSYARNFTYNAAGAVTSMQLGNGHWESTQFNSRLQPTQIALGATPNAANLLKLDYTYGTTANNGNVLSQTITVKRPSQSDLVFDQLYTYDSLNRITSAEEKTGTTVNWSQTYIFDRYGNRNFNESLTTTLPKGCLDGSEPVMCNADRKIFNPELNAANNRMAAGQGWAYDAAGNVTTDAEGRTFIYDGENKQIEVKNSSNATVGQYYFDGDGKRVKKVVPGTGEVTIFIYDAGAKLIGEYSTVVQSVENAKVAYLTNDHLGSPRINTDRDGNVTSRTDYYPYGEEIIAHGGRTANEGYVADDIRQGFTGYERDNEINLNFAQARMFNYSHGRFTSPDPLMASASSNNPQSWNRYIYTFNNPLKFIDPTGMVVDDYFINRDGSYVVVEDDCKCDTYYIETEKGSGEYRKLTTLKENDLGLVEFPAEMDFFIRYGKVDHGGGEFGPGDHFVKPEVAAGLFGMAAVLKDEYGITMSFGDMSSSNGKDPWQPGEIHHQGHGGAKGRSGLDVDFRYINKDGVSFPGAKARSSSQFSVEKNQTVYDTAKKFGFTENYQGNVQGRNTGVNGVKVDNNGGHNDHGHLGYNRDNARITYAKGITLLGSRGTYKPIY